MCGRSSLTKTEKELEARFKASFYSEDLEKYNPLPNYNVAPTHVMPVIKNKDKDHFAPLRWGLIPFWAKDHKIGYKMINARIETLHEKAAFKQALQKRRCIIPMDGYYEWKKMGKGKVPHRIVLKDREIFAVAGLWEKWKSPMGEAVESFTVITQDASASIVHIHDRMPAILTCDAESVWIDEGISTQDALSIIHPYADEQIRAYPVSKRVGKVSENDAELIEEVVDGALPGAQTALF
ncbi:MAG: SOS response-associated peptidase [Saprospiraceae bacterium]|nr:SOS response-associated peptidase [Saprospiraceae bacterium]